ncbi:MAG: polyphenol oxidase family protein [Nocardioides sp.]
MFGYRESREGDVRVDVAFTDSSLDLQEARPDLPAALAQVEGACGVPLARLHQVHGDEVLVLDAPTDLDRAPSADALVTTRRGLGLMVRAADCVPILLADPGAGVIGAAHAGRSGVALDIVGRTVEQMRDLGADRLVGWIGPHVCGSCYEVPEQMRAEVAALVPATETHTSWGTPALDLGAGVRAQLDAAGVAVVEVGGCTREDARLHSYRRDGAAAGRLGALVWMS